MFSYFSCDHGWFLSEQMCHWSPDIDGKSRVSDTRCLTRFVGEAREEGAGTRVSRAKPTSSGFDLWGIPEPRKQSAWISRVESKPRVFYSEFFAPFFVLLKVVFDKFLKVPAAFSFIFQFVRIMLSCPWDFGLKCTRVYGRPEGEQGGANASPGFGYLVEHLVKILSFCVKILTFGQKTNICSPLTKFAPPTKTPMDDHARVCFFKVWISVLEGKGLGLDWQSFSFGLDNHKLGLGK